MFSNDISSHLRQIFPTDIASCFIQFNQQNYHDRLFEQLGINFPESIQKSVTKRKSEFLAGRLCSQKCLTHFNKTDNIGIGSNRQPIWPANFLGAITHTSDIAAAILTKEGLYAGIGLDMENVMSIALANDLCSQFMSTKEQNYCRSSTIPSNLAYTLIFSAKESFFKAAFPIVKKYFDFSAVEVLHISKETINFKVVEKLSKELQPGYEFTVNWRQINSKTILTYTLLPVLNAH